MQIEGRPNSLFFTTTTTTTAQKMSIKLEASSPTDIWRKPPGLEVNNAPSLLHEIHSSKFHKASVTVNAAWTRLYDQGGILLQLPTKAGDKQRWIKTGIEFYNDRANLSTVAARDWADWSLLPLSSKSVAIEVEREPIDAANGKGSSIWVYMVDGEKKVAVREVTWAFEIEGDMKVGLYAARPTGPHDETKLQVQFDNFEYE
ncbi:hypothetical protein SCHPADRAFT_909993 [Schizopora paradoxa]|uniref:DUF1349-domain-containing protein n=1 Tax=Schizopora paradoxa TaxID=27342 RepID=A0A0H2RPT7_9AGAM|nr:hypothetical protein SCHPADRAFT_909993 [Schizopora paradoxa]